MANEGGCAGKSGKPREVLRDSRYQFATISTFAGGAPVESTAVPASTHLSGGAARG